MGDYQPSGNDLAVALTLLILVFGLCAIVLHLISVDERAARRAWPNTQEAEIWRRFGFTDDKSWDWTAARFSPPAASAWRKAGVTTPASAQTWQRLVGFPDKVPSEVVSRING